MVIHVFPDLCDRRYMHLIQKFLVLQIISRTLLGRQYPDESLLILFIGDKLNITLLFYIMQFIFYTLYCF